MKVKAIRAGFFGIYRNVGDVFDFPESRKLGSWMVKVADDAKTEKPAKPERPKPIGLGEITAAQRVADQKIKELGV